MTRITADLLRRRAEHNDGALATLREIALHQQGIERIELINQACRHLRILYLQNNLIAKIENLHRLKELEHLNLAVNNITAIENLERCESLRKVDLTLNFVAVPALPSVQSLRPCECLQELHLVGNPCTAWPGYRAFVVGSLPQLQRLDGDAISNEERAAALAALPQLQAHLSQISIAPCDEGDIVAEARETLEQEPDDLQRWSPATRVRDHMEHEARMQEANARRDCTASRTPLVPEDGSFWGSRPRRDALPPLPEDGQPLQCNEGQWQFCLEEDDAARQLVLGVELERHLDLASVQVDVQPHAVRLLAKGRLLQLRLPVEVRPAESSAKRSKASGRMVITMPYDRGEVVCARRRGGGKPPVKLIADLKSCFEGSEAGVVVEHAGGCEQGGWCAEDRLPPLPA